MRINFLLIISLTLFVSTIICINISDEINVVNSAYVNIELISIEWRKECSDNNRCTKQRFQINSNMFGSHEFHRIDYPVFSKHTTKSIILHSYYEQFHPYDLIISSKVIGYDEFFKIPIDCDESAPIFSYTKNKKIGEDNESLITLVGKCYTAHLSITYYQGKPCPSCVNENKIDYSPLTLSKYVENNYYELICVLIILITVFSISSIILIILIFINYQRMVRYRRRKELVYPISPLTISTIDSECNQKSKIEESKVISKIPEMIDKEAIYINYNKEKNTSTTDSIKTEKMQSVKDWIHSKHSSTIYFSDYESYKQKSLIKNEEDNLSTASTSLFGGACGSNPESVE
uniref:Ephrin_rec_like domain-containing protein n=1 Tax=Parastrongyloides trichosuri TaxID=131310 RepID=A0A0N4ZMR4_PARTI